MTMKMKRISIITLVLAAFALLPAHAQTLRSAEDAGNFVTVNNSQVTVTDSRTIVSLDFVLDSLAVRSNSYRAFTPVLVSKDKAQQQRLKSLLITGRRQDIVFQRDGVDALYAENCDVVRRLKGEAQGYAYSDVVDYQPWHSSAALLLEDDLCGCGDTLNTQLSELLRLKPEFVPQLANIVPDPVKPPRNLHGSAFITFVVDRWEMKPDYMDNARELRKITDTLDVMVADKNISVDRIQIHGWASPESPYEHNRMLATNRAQSLTDYVRFAYRLPASVFAPAKATPENWIGLKEAVEGMSTSQLPHKAEFLKTINKVLADIKRGVTNQADRDELALKANYRSEYDYLLKQVYPHLRRSDYDITFKVREFTLQEACEIYKTHPDQLSLREFWDVANTFEPYSDEYNRVLQTAYNFNPDSTVAAINLANIALKQGDLLKAESLLDHAGDSGEANNARGCVAILRKDYTAAREYLLRARQQGVDVSQNLEFLDAVK